MCFINQVTKAYGNFGDVKQLTFRIGIRCLIMTHTSIVFHLVLKTSNKIVLCPGLPRSGTTSLWHMLKKAKFLNAPCKEPHFLTVLSDEKTDSPTFFPKEFKNRYHQYVYELNREKLNINPPYTLDSYRRYIQEYSYDFSQSYWYISEDYLREIKKSLFDLDIKIILLYREPVQRLFSFCNLVCNEWNLNYSPKKLFYKFLDSDNCSNLYPHLYHKYVSVFDNVICFKTETFFNSRNEQERLLEFLDLPPTELERIYLNQSNSYNQLSERDIAIGKEKLKQSYDFYSII